MSCLQIPQDTEKMRQLLFEMPVPFTMRADVFEKYWPMVDNVWSRYDEINLTGRDGICFNSIRFACRFLRRLSDEYIPAQPSPKRQRREGGTCTCRVKAKYYHGVVGVPDHYQFEHSSQKESDWAHSHTIDESDVIKINSFLKAAAALEAAKGHMPADVYKDMRNVKLFDIHGNYIGDALDAAGGKFMTRQHANNAKQSALSFAGNNFMNPRNLADVRSALGKRPNTEERVAGLARIVSVDPRTVWPENIGGKADDERVHGRIIKNDIRSLVESIAIGGRTTVPLDILLPLLNSIADYMDKTCEDEEGKSLLESITKVQEQRGITPQTPRILLNSSINNMNGFG